MKPCPDCDSPLIFAFPSQGDGKCSKCHGTGELGLFNPEIIDKYDCYVCHTTGQCQTCGGTGRVVDDEDDEYSGSDSGGVKGDSEEDSWSGSGGSSSGYYSSSDDDNHSWGCTFTIFVVIVLLLLSLCSQQTVTVPKSSNQNTYQEPAETSTPMQSQQVDSEIREDPPSNLSEAEVTKQDNSTPHQPDENRDLDYFDPSGL